MSSTDLYRRTIEVSALIRCAMLAEENDTSGIKDKGTADVLRIAERLMENIIEGVETIERQGWAKPAQGGEA
jgi:hypothetical protein